MAQRNSKVQGADHRVMRELNRSLVLDVLKKHPRISRASIAKVADLAKPTVSAIVDDLIREGLAREIGVGETNSSGGRPPILLEFDARSQFVVGVCLGVRMTTISVADARGKELARLERRTPGGKPSKALEKVTEWIESELAAANAPRHRLAAVGVCIPGLVDLESGDVLLAPNLGWRDVAVRRELHERLGVAVYVHNAAQAVAVAEALEGAATGATEVVALYEDVGIGAGVLTQGRLFHGATGFPGEIGHCVVPGADERCQCGKYGCLETIASADAVAQAYLKRARKRVTGELPDLATLGTRDEPAAVAVLGEAGRMVGIAASWLVNLFNPEVVVVAGGFLDGGEALFKPLEAAAREHTLPQIGANVSVRLSTLGADAPVRGAVLLALQSSETYYRLVFQG